MESPSTSVTSACDGCKRHAFVLRMIDGAKLCDRCTEKSAQIDRQLARERSSDPVNCDGCSGAVLSDLCKPVEMERQV